MLTNVRGLIAELSFQTKNLKQAQEFQDRIENIRASLEGMAAMARKAAIAFTAFSAGVGKITYDLGQATSEIHRNANAVGASVEEYQALSYAFERLDLDANDMMDTFTQVSDRVLAASTGSKNYADALQRLGLSHQELLALDPARALAKIADATRSIENPMERAAIAASLLGEESARKLLPALTAGGKALSDYMAEARKAGAIMTKEQIEKGREVNDTFNKLKLTLTVLKNEIALALAPVVIRFVTRLNDWYEANRELINQKVEEYADRIAAAFERAYNALKRINQEVGGLEGWIDIMEKIAKAVGTAAFAQFLFYVTNLVLAVRGLAVAMAGALGVALGKLIAIVGIVVVAIGTLALAIEDAIGEMQGAESITGMLRKNMQKLNPVAKFFASVWITIATVLQTTYKAVQEKLIPVLKRFLPFLKILGLAVLAIVAAFLVAASVVIALAVALATILLSIVVTILEVFAAIIGGIYDVIAWFFNVVGDLIPNLKNVVNKIADVVMDGLSAAKDFIMELVDDILGLPSKAAEALSAIDFGGFFDFGTPAVQLSSAGAAPTTAAVPVTAAIGSRAPSTSTNVQQQQQTTINVNGSTDPAATAREVSRRQKDVNDAWANSAYQQARGGNR